MHPPPCPPRIDALDPRVLLSLTLAATLPAIDGGTLTPLKKDDSGGDEGNGKKAKKTQAPEITGLLGGASLAGGSASVDFGRVTVGAAAPVRTFTIRNDGRGPLTL